jgi:glycosyltransferase involved in cell wall biosynthesis
MLSVITVTYNSGLTIRNTLNSLKEQTNRNIFELIIVDAISNDKTINIIDEFKNDFKITKIIEKDLGIYDAMNKGAKIANGKYLLFLNSDDILYDKSYLKIFNNILTKSSPDIIYSKVLFKKNKLGLNREYNPEKFLISEKKQKWLLPHPGTFIKKEIFQKLDGFSLKYKISSDFDFFLRATKIKDIKYHFIDTYSVLMSVGGASSGIKNVIKSNLECLDSLRKNNIKNKTIFILTKIFNKLVQLKVNIK